MNNAIVRKDVSILGLISKIECFKIQILKSNYEDLFNLRKAERIKAILCDSSCILKEPKTIIADPFLFVYRDTLFLFYEDKLLYKDGVISMIKTKDLEHWSKPVTVLKENCHLSYPWVFEENGHVYMIPETSHLRSIRLYEAENEDLSSFTYKKTLLDSGDNYSDSSIYKNLNCYYLMTTIRKNGENQLKLYYADRLFGPYLEHVNSPIAVSNKYGRNAGSVFEYDGCLFRPAQDCVNGYGDNVHILKIEKIGKHEYSEKPYIDNLLGKADEFYQCGGHQFNYVVFKGLAVIATDSKEYHYFLLQRILDKTGLFRL